MKPDPSLRQRAEQAARERPTDDLEALSSQDRSRLVRELRVHQIELEMQNEELRRSQEELEVARSRYYDLYNAAPVGYLTLTPEGKMAELNQTAASLLGRPKDELVGRSLTEVIAPEDQDLFYLHRKQSTATQAPQVVELRLLGPQAEPFWARLETSLDDQSGLRVVVSDLSETRRIEEEKAVRLAQLRQLEKSESLRRMAGAIAHHVNNQLQTVLGNLEALGETGGSGPLEEATQACQRIGEVSRLLLTYLGQAACQRQPLNLSRLCQVSLALLELPTGTVQEGNWDCEANILADAPQLEQVLGILLGQARKATGEGRGAIRIGVEKVGPCAIGQKIRFPWDFQPKATAYACLEVQDHGRPIAEEDRDRLFDPYFSTAVSSSGMDLPVVLGIVRAHEGVITLESSPEQGNVFRLYFPLCSEPARAVPESGPVRPDRFGTVLLVDDDPGVRKVVKIMLERLGYTVLLARDGAEALELWSQDESRIGWMLCDLSMPGMNGWEVLIALRQQRPDLPVILTSGYDDSWGQPENNREWPQAFLSKPFLMQGLQQAIGQALTT